MSAEPDFRIAIRQAAASLGKVPDTDQIEALQTDFAGRWYVDADTGHVQIATARGPAVRAR